MNLSNKEGDMKFGVVTFPGSNCDDDCVYVIKNVLGAECDKIWHKEEKSLSSYSCIVLPGGFSYGDYLRPGGIAKFSPVMERVKEYAEAGGLVLGICNGFQILVESGLLEGVLIRNKSLNFICKDVYLKVENRETPFTNSCRDVLRIPIAHKDGCFYCDKTTYNSMEKNGQIIFRYCGVNGEIGEEYNPNGSLYSVAGICNKEKNVLGMMPHPERCSEEILKNVDGELIFKSIINFLHKKSA
jgi:phosphoribosylformylglycinamidine synthase